jgi:hypothetical protein
MKFSAVKWRGSLLLALVILISLTLLGPVHAAPLPQGADIAQITSPTEGQALSGLVTISGSANHPEFARWELAYGPDPNPNDAWQPFAEGTQPVDNGTIGTWNTGVIADGPYALRLRVIRKDSNYSEGFVRGLKVSNSGPVGTPTSIPPAPTFPAEQATLPAEEAIQPIATVMVEQPPTNIPEAPASTNATPRSTAASNRSAAAAVPGLNFSQFGSACVSGIALTVGLFVIVGVIQVGRWGVKQVRRQQKRKP